jgi:hypothetical protein
VDDWGRQLGQTGGLENLGGRLEEVGRELEDVGGRLGEIDTSRRRVEQVGVGSDRTA